jgi:anti-anti-sigma factor
MQVQHETQPVGRRTTTVAGPDARNGLRGLPRPFTAFAHIQGDNAVVMLHGELDVASVAILIDCFMGIAFAVDEVVLDFAELDFIDGCGLRSIADASRQVVAYGGSVSIRSPRPQVQRLLELVDFKQIVAIQP